MSFYTSMSLMIWLRSTVCIGYLRLFVMNVNGKTGAELSLFDIEEAVMCKFYILFILFHFLSLPDGRVGRVG